MQESLLDFMAVLKALNACNVRYVLIGGLAMIAHGADHITQDIDVGYARDRENLKALTEAPSGAHPRPRDFPLDLPFIWDERTLRAASNFTLETDMAAVDLLGEIAGIESFEGLWERSQPTELYGMPVRIASLDDLVAMKRAANRPKDQRHLLELEALRKLLQSEASTEEK